MPDSREYNVPRLYRKKPISVGAMRMDKEFQVDTLEGSAIKGKAGDYLVGPGAKGEFWPVDAEVFEQTYELVESL